MKERSYKEKRRDYLLTGIVFIVLTSFIFIPKLIKFLDYKKANVSESQVEDTYNNLMKKFKDTPIVSKGNEVIQEKYSFYMPKSWEYQCLSDFDWNSKLLYIVYSRKDPGKDSASEMTAMSIKLDKNENFTQKKTEYISEIEKKTTLSFLSEKQLPLDNGILLTKVYFSNQKINRTYVYGFYQKKSVLIVTAMNSSEKDFQKIEQEYDSFANSFEIKIIQ